MTVLNFLQERDPPPKRAKSCLDGQKEKHFTEAAVMLSFALHLLESYPNSSSVRICPDGEHAKRFDIKNWLELNGFNKTEVFGSTAYGGKYVRDGHTIFVTPTSGFGDVVIETGAENVIAECKGGVVNTKHAGQTSRLRKGLCEVVGLLMAAPVCGRQVAVVPHTSATLRLAEKMLPRAKAAGIEIALVHGDGKVEYVSA